MIGKEEGSSTSYSVISIKNLSWPGAYLICNNNSWANIYFGYGQKVNQ